jgi:outer membrane receptor protein involved in Fe transport
VSFRFTLWQAHVGQSPSTVGSVKPIIGVAAQYLDAWLDASKITEGALWRRIQKGHETAPLSPTRYFSTHTTEVGSVVGSFGCGRLSTNFLPGPVPNPCLNHSDFTNINALGLDRTYSGFRSRASLSWKLSADAILYYTWSQGFRAGGFNRGFTTPGYSPLYPGPNPWQVQAYKHGGWVPSLAFAPDNLTNNEVGWKTSWLNQRLHWIVAVYQENWDHAQIAAFDPDLIGNGVINGGDYRVRGVETSVVSRITSGLSVEIGAAWNHSELVKEASFFWADGTPIDFRSLQTYAGQKVSNPAGTVGTPLAGAPSFQSNLRARYEVALGDYNAFVQIGAVHQSHSFLPQIDSGLPCRATSSGTTCRRSRPTMGRWVWDTTHGSRSSTERI